MSMEDLLQAILGGAGAQLPSAGAQSSGPQDPLAEILGSILGGGRQQPSRGAQQGSGDIGDILGGILGGGAQKPSRGAQQGAGGIGDILGGILGGSASMNSNTFLGPIIQKLAQQLGLPPAVAQVVVSFILNKIMSGAAGRAVTPAQPAPSQILPPQRPWQQVPQAQQGLDLDDLLGQISTGETPDTGYLSRTGMTSELSLQTGMDANTAAMSLQQAFKLLGGALGSFQQPQRTTRAKRTTSKRRTAQRTRPKSSKSTKTRASKSTSTKSSRSKTTTRKRSTAKKGGSASSDLDSILSGFEIK